MVGPINAEDEPIADGQHLLVSTHAWWSSTEIVARRDGPPRTTSVALVEHRIDVWVPVELSHDWLMDRRTTGRRIQLRGEPRSPQTGRRREDGLFRAPHGDFHAHLRTGPLAPLPADWAAPDRDFLDQQPRTVDALLEALMTAHPLSRRSAADVAFGRGAAALRTGRVPADLRAAVYAALRRLPGVEVDDTRDVDGRPCLALRHHGTDAVRELLIEPENGHYAGERETRTTDRRFPAGIPCKSTSVVIAVAD